PTRGSLVVLGSTGRHREAAQLFVQHGPSGALCGDADGLKELRFLFTARVLSPHPVQLTGSRRRSRAPSQRFLGLVSSGAKPLLRKRPPLLRLLVGAPASAKQVSDTARGRVSR